MSKPVAKYKTDPVDAALADYMQRVDAGQTVDNESFIAEYPQFADELREFLESAQIVEQMAGPPLDSTQAHARKTSETQATGVGDSVPNNQVRKTLIVPGDLPPGPFGRYEIVKRLGRGAMGAVYLARDNELDRQVALKTPTFDTNTDTEMVERFKSEARAAAKLQHPGICAIFDVGEINGTHFISMAFIDGKPLSGLINVDKPLPIRTVVSLVRRLAIALDKAHSAGVIHRDLKPDNIMIDRQRNPVIMDFGLARQIGKPQEVRITQAGTILGTPAYMSPEQLSGTFEAGKKSDIYSLGVIFYELLCGNLPFSASIPAIFGQILTQSPLPLSQQRTEIDSQIESICRKMMARNAGDRYESMAEVANVLTDYLKGRAPNASQNQPPPATEPAEHAAGRPTSSSQQSAATQTVTESEGLAGFLDAASQDELPVLATRHDGTFKQLAAPLKAISPRKKVIATALLAGLLLVMGVVVMLRTPYGTLQLEVNDPNVTVKIDGKTLELVDCRWNDDLKASPHHLAVLVGETPVPLGETTTVSIDGERRKVGLSVSGVELADNKFTVTRGDETAMTISLILLPADSKPADSNSEAPSTRFDGKILISPKSATGYGVGQLLKGEILELNYLSGKWKGWGRHATESPDARKQEQGNRCRLAICQIDAKGANRVLKIVPPGTAKRPFRWKADRHYEMVVLRINDSDGKFSSNPGSGVKYRLKILSAGTSQQKHSLIQNENDSAENHSASASTPSLPEYAAFATGKWIPILANQAGLAGATVHSGEKSRVPRTWMVDSSGKVEGLTIEKEIIRFSRDMIVSLNRYQANNLIIRATVRNLDIEDLNVSLVWPKIRIVSAFNKGEDNFGMRLFYVWNVGENCFRGWQPFGFASRPQQSKEFEFAIARLGGRVRAYLNGRMIQEFGISPHLPQCAPGLGTAKGSSSFRNIEVQILDDKKVAEIDVNSPIVSRGKWKWEGNELVLDSSEDDTGCILFGNPAWTDYDFQAEVKADESRVAQLLFLAESTLQFSAAFVRSKQDEEGRSLLAVESHHPVRQEYRLDAKDSPLAPLDEHAWHTIRVSVRGRKCSVAVNGSPSQTYDNRLHSTNDNNLKMWQQSANRVGFRTWKGTARYRNFKVTSPDGKLLFSASDLKAL